jgi:acyl-CoA thioester hydrolase
MTAPIQKSAYPFFVSEQVRFNDLDALGHVNNNSFGIYFESARVGFMMMTGLRHLPTDPAVVVRHLTIDYLAELHFPAALEVGIGIARIGTSSVTLGCAVFKGDRCVATSEAVMVRIDATTRRPQALGAEERALLAPYLIANYDAV